MKPFLSLAHLVACLLATAAPAKNSQVVKVVLGEDGKPVPKAQLRLWEVPSPGWGKKFKHVFADEAGRCEIAPKAGGTVYVEAHEPGLIGRGVTAGPKVDPLSDPLEIKLWLGTKVTGRILEPDGTPAANAQFSAGVYLHNKEWKKRFGLSLAWMSFDHGQWPNWSTTVLTDPAGRFHVTVPPRKARSWIRLGTSSLGFSSHMDVALAKAQSKPLAARFAPFEKDFQSNQNEGGKVDVGDISLERGIILHGKVLDGEGQPMEGTTLITSGRHGPYAGRRTISNERGEYRFFPHAPGQVTISVDARYRDDAGKVLSRDVRGIFAKTPVTLSNLLPDLNVTLQARQFVTLKFDIVDRRRPSSDRISYYNYLPVTGHMKVNGKLQYWKGETQRKGPILIVKVPVGLQNAKLVLPGDKFATISYADETGLKGKGRLELPNLDPKLKRTIYCDLPSAK